MNDYPKTATLQALAGKGNIEVFYVDAGEAKRNRAEYRKYGRPDDYANCARVGWYYWCCLPGCLPDSDAFGPFTSARAALRDAWDNDMLGDEA